MYKVCDELLCVISEWPTLAAAKDAARLLAALRPSRIWFVCGKDGLVIAGF